MRLLSVIIPVHNEERRLGALIRAFSTQDLSQCELLFVDDGSTDASCKILSDAISSGRISAKLICQTCRGVGAARNIALSAASGEYVSFVDADDAISPNYVSRMCFWACQGRDINLFSHTRCVQSAPSFASPAKKPGKTTPDALSNALLRNPTRFGIYDFLIRRELITQAGLTFPEGYPYYEDYDFILHALQAAKTAVNTGECVYCYQATAGSAMSIFNTERLRCLELFQENRSLYLKRSPFYENFRRWFCARLYWSVLWQACQCMTADDAWMFARSTDAGKWMRKLLRYPDVRVAFSAATYLVSPRAYIFFMKLLGNGRTLLSAGKDT